MRGLRCIEILLFLAIGVIFPAPGQAQSSPHELDGDALREEVLKLAELPTPTIYPISRKPVDGIQSIYYEGLDWKGTPTRVFALLGIPESEQPLPAVILVHGGGGTAFQQWVKLWNQQGFAAIAIAVEGQTDDQAEQGGWQRHDWAGPARKGIYADSDQPLQDQWIYHAVADSVLAHALLRSRPEIDAEKIGLVGISWGGVIASTVIGIDQRLAFAVPIYGCGDLQHSDNQYGLALSQNQVYQEVWDPMLRMSRVSCPVLWLSWTEDQHFPLDSQLHCYQTMTKPYMVSLVADMQHSHTAGWNPPDSYAFARSVIETGKPWFSEKNAQSLNGEFEWQFDSQRSVDHAELVYSTQTGFTGKRSWLTQPLKWKQDQTLISVQGQLPQATTGWFVRFKCGPLTACSDFQEVRQDRK